METQHEIILRTMLNNKSKTWWYASDFQRTVGYEASPRMSEISYIYSNIVEKGKDGRFRTLRIKWENEKEVNELIKKLDL